MSCEKFWEESVASATQSNKDQYSSAAYKVLSQ